MTRPLNDCRITCLLMCLTALSLMSGCKTTPVTESAPHQASPAGAQNASSPAPVNLPAPFGHHTDDLDNIFERRNLRALVIINPTGFFYDNGHPMGVMYEALRDLETYINQKQKTKALKIKVSFIPVRIDEVEAALAQGVGDFIAFPVVITPDRQRKIAFTVPLASDLKQVVVTGPKFGSAASIEELGGKEIFVNPLTANYQTLQELSAGFEKAGKSPIRIKPADNNLTDDDLLEMTNAGLIPATVTNQLKAKLWSQILPHLAVREDLVIASNEQIAWALRKDNPKLKELLDGFIAPRALGTSFGNTLLRRYLQNTKWVRNSTSGKEMQKLGQLSGIFKKYAGQYDFDYLMIMAQGYQESMLDQSARYQETVGIMQVNPKLAAAPPINVKNVNTAENNIEAGVKMLRYFENTYFNDPNISRLDKTLMVFASYNAGPTRIARLRKQAAAEGLDPNKWFNNVELIVAKEVGQVTVTYVSNIYKYYIAYKLALGDEATEKQAQKPAGM
jgi:membrane-bound lytic murein transglycosylase MltF